MGKFTTTINGVPNQYKLARYRWMWWIRQYPDSANDFSQVFALIDAANTPTTSPAYYANVEALVDTEEWLRLSAIEHATGDWDSCFTQNSVEHVLLQADPGQMDGAQMGLEHHARRWRLFLGTRRQPTLQPRPQ